MFFQTGNNNNNNNNNGNEIPKQKPTKPKRNPGLITESKEEE